MPAISRAWRMRPERKWYIFFEGDTYLVWDNIFRWLEHFDPDEPHYFGYPSPGRRKTSFANGGPGYILSREAMRRLIKNDWDPETGVYLGSKLTERCWNDIWENCCGNSVLGFKLLIENVTLSGLFPMTPPHSLDGLPFSGPKKHWCQPVLSLHRPSTEDMLGMWTWEWERRKHNRPLLYRDLAISYFDFANLPIRYDWNAAKQDSLLAPQPSEPSVQSAHESIETCSSACQAHDKCFSWTYHLQQCFFSPVLRYGQAMEPSVEAVKKDDKPQGEEADRNVEDLRFVTGWNTRKISSWIDDHPCDPVEWVHPSLTRT